MNVVIIPARGGSKENLKKNLHPFCGKPLIFWTVNQAKKSKLVDKIIVTSDDQEILEYCKNLEVDTIKRPKNISGDKASSEDALIHCIEKFKLKNELIIFLQATSPLRYINDIDDAIQKSFESKNKVLFSASKLEDIIIWEKSKNTLKCVNSDWKNRKPRQTNKKEFIIENGSIYIFPSNHILQYKNRMSHKMGVYMMELWQSYEIDTLKELKFCEKQFYENLPGQIKNDIT